MSLLLVSTISDNKINSPKDPSSGSEVYEPLSDIWKDDPPTIKDFPFNEETELKLDVPENASPILFFKLIAFDQKVRDDLVKKINKYATKLINHNRPIRCRSLWNSWKDVSSDEIKRFIGLIFSMGLISFPSYKKYWSNDLLYKNEHFSYTMSREQFESILRFFNFGE